MLPATSPVRERTTSAKLVCHMKMKLRRCSSGPTRIRNGTSAATAMTIEPTAICRMLFATSDQIQNASSAGTRTRTERHSTEVSAMPVLAENAIVTSQK